LSSENHRATTTGDMYRNFVKFGRVAFEICERTDRRVDRNDSGSSQRRGVLMNRGHN